MFDAGDHVLDSGAIIDNLRVEAAGEDGCDAGANLEIAIDDQATTPEDTAVDVDVVANDLFAATATPSVLLATQPAHGTASCTTAGVCTYTPNPDFHGTDSFTYLVDDGLGASDNGTVHLTVTPVNDNPVANPDAIDTNQGVPGSTNVLANDSDVDGDTLSISAFSQGANGTVGCAGATCTYTPAAGFSGTDSFTYTVSDGKGGSATATVAVTVNPAGNTCAGGHRRRVEHRRGHPGVGQRAGQRQRRRR
ncbi:MAG: cadherin-like domain-containing protein [Microthrixaceae bacterium]|nr:cadherin-like domain-containing protein [Microthrixaceae bacterium]